MKNKFYILVFILIPFISQSQISIDGLLNEKCDIPEVSVLENSRDHSGRIINRNLSEELEKEFQAILNIEYAKSGAAGLSCAVLLGQEEWTGVAGISSVTDSMKSEMVLGVGSLSKSIAAVTILKLEEEGKVNIEDKVSKWLGNREFVDSTIIIRQLLNHTSGVYNVTENPRFGTMINSDYERVWLPEEVLDTFLKEPYFTPGNGYHYSNSNFILIGMIVEKVTGQKYHEVVRSRVLKPYGLDSMYLKPFENNSLEVGHLWADPLGGDNGVDLTGFGIEFKALFSGAWAAGAYMGRTKDITKWIKMLAKGKVLTDKSNEELLTGVSLGNNIYYGLGIIYVLDSNGDTIAIGHDGNIGYTTKVYHLLNEDLTIGIQCNDITVNKNTLNNIFTRFISAYNSYVLKTNDFYEKELLTISPNPASDYIEINFSNYNNSAMGVNIYNSCGESIYSNYFNSNRNISIDISSFPKGLYFVRAGQFVERFVVE